MPARSITLEQVVPLIERQLGRKAPAGGVQPDMPLEQTGLSSLDVTEVFFEIESLVGTELDPTAAADVKTARELVDAVNALVGGGGADGVADPVPAVP